jgi:catechol 2,3-dioxygenase-like lactoylglutathione lyase family enzyme
MEILGITRVVKNLEKSRRFYEDILGFEAGSYYEPTRWQPYKCQSGVFYAIGEGPGSTNEIAFAVRDVEELWKKVRDKAEVVSPLERTPWGTYRFVIRDIDGNLLAFDQKSDNE